MINILIINLFALPAWYGGVTREETLHIPRIQLYGIADISKK